MLPRAPVAHGNGMDKVKVKKAIENQAAVLCFDAAVKNNCMAYHAILTDKNNTFETTYEEYTNVWNATKSDMAEGRALLGILNHVQQILPPTTTGSLEILTDSQNTIKWTSVKYTASRAAKPGGEIWVGVQKIQESMAGIKFQYTWIPGHPKPCTDFKKNAHAYLITKVHHRACSLRRNMEQESCTIHIQEIETGTIYYNNKRDFRSVNTLLKEEDSKEHLYQYLSAKFPEYVQLIDVNARGTFGSKLQLHEIKCAAGYNHYRCRDKLINPLVTDKCDACGALEDWTHILTCRINCEKNKKFLNDLKQQLLKFGTLQDDIERFIHEIGEFFKGRNNMRGTQALLGYKYLFRGIVVNDWFGTDDSKGTYHVFNKIIVRLCVKHYVALWRARNERKNDPVLRKQRFLEWAENENALLKNHIDPNVARYLEQYDSIKKMSADAIKLWLHNLHTFKKNSKHVVTNDIRSFLVPRS